MEEDNVCPCHQDSWASRGALAEHLADALRRQLQRTEAENDRLLLDIAQLEKALEDQPTRIQEVQQEEQRCRIVDKILKKRERDLRRDIRAVMEREEAATDLEERLRMQAQELGRRTIALAGGQ